MESTDKVLSKQYGLVLNKAWSDEGFKKALLANPKQVLADEGMELPDGLEVSIIDGQDVQSYDSSKNLLTLPLPKAPAPIHGVHVLADACCCCCPCCSCCC